MSLPPQYDISGAVDHGDAKGDRQNYNYPRKTTAGQSFTDNYGFVDHATFNPKFQNDVTMSFTTNQFQGGLASAINSHTTHLQTLTQLQSPGLSYSMTVDGYTANTPSYLQKEPEFEIRPNNSLFPKLKAIPITGDFFLGEYNDQVAPKTTSKGESKITMGPALAHFLDSDFSATIILDQDAYGTGDLKAQIGQQATLTTSLWGHMVNTISYTDSHVNGPAAEPFKSLDVLATNTKQGNDNLRIFNSDIYTLSLTASTFFNRQAQAVGYQLTARPSPRSTVLIGGSFNPGPGQGFYQTSLQFATPFGYKSDLQFSTFVDWKNKGRLISKNIYYRHVVGDCYEIRVSYNQDIKQVNLSVDLLAFPSHPVNFGIGQNNSLGSVIPQSFVFGQ
ncbi:MAG: hypothetical protein JOY59_03040 [Candidatus Eremiobacteraeota bacterium]|nr:hypothetical protein [Candidatus Eremiobacteraeota bacterium]